MDNKALASEADKYLSIAQGRGFSSALEMVAKDDGLKWGKVDGKWTLVNIASSAFMPVIDECQQGLLGFLQKTGEITLEDRSLGNIKYTVYIAGDELAAVISAAQASRACPTPRR